ncbi:MAG: hypothetical protein A3B14_01785 [Candidatus Zambryskibacteria bacterium RIFCSPLOWO2_01_FULL_45_21]|uniref:tRNA-dihydrouridine synthase n=1 Tax=Candidatus Zambryskibacteria bacterium RIFCSPLOWO2_01_FULL_45_21 TaxID=1802761 RepID=A0A1G2U3R4_9BACT|nr:MAG: hypothetical protein A3B14_01785 [Candidatus Zambryskibacteria bacterium RIFCSPLOWO2_01_FULL_45_21]
MSFLSKLPRPFFVLAPMDDITDTVFRQIVAGCAPPDLYFTEFVNVDGLQSPGREKLLHKLRFGKKETPIIAQIWGLKPENFYKTTKELIKMGFDGVDLNLGCPVKTVIKNGACAALMNNRELAGEIIEATREGARSTGSTSSPQASSGLAGKHFPVSVKTRVGFTTVDMSWLEFLLSKKLNMLSIHGRSAKQHSDKPPDWDAIGQVRKIRDFMFPAPIPQPMRLDGMQGADEQHTELYGKGTAKEQPQSATPQSAKSTSGTTGSASRQAGAAHELRTLIVGNGDVMSRAQGLELADKYKLDGIMIGRGVFADPFVFAQQSPWAGYTQKQKIELYRRHVELFAKTWTKGERRIETLNKFCKVYISGFDGAKELREQLMSAKSTGQLLDMLG